MDAWVWVVIAIAAIVVVAVAAYSAVRARRRRTLQEGFGPEYDRAVAEAPSRREAEEELRERRERHDEFELRPLEREARARYVREWEATQARFVDDPVAAVGEADDLIQQVMRDRGYPIEDFDQRAADLSVDHPELVENYRAGHAISRSALHDEAKTEDLRQAMVHYRSLFEELLETRERSEA
ncbi:MAG: hypothetical protein ACRDN6_04215 [Gaiellaceae bacterium]